MNNNENAHIIDFTSSSFHVRPMKKEPSQFMWSPVEKAVEIVQKIITLNEKSKNNAAGKNKEGEPNHATEHNNIIVFTGDRGSGKSTVMRTFIKEIKEKPRKDGDNSTEENKSIHILMPIIDPTVFAEDERLIGAIVSHIFDAVKTAMDDPNERPNNEATRKVYECCDSVHAALKVVYTGVKVAVQNEIDSLESLERLTSTTLLRVKLHDLFEKFMIWGGYGTLIIPIDDLDMKLQGNYDLLEEIRNYLCKQGVVVVMSVKFEQLTDSIEQHFKEQLKGLPPTSNALDAQPAEMASKYLQKLLPTPRRIALPVFRAERLPNYKVKIFASPEQDPEKGAEGNLVNKFLELIYRKTGIVLVKNHDESHGLLPHNLRALNHLFNMLTRLKDIGNFEDKSKRAELEHNLNRIEEWVLDSACSNSVPRGLARIAREFAIRPTTGIHAYLIKELDIYSAKSEMRSCDGEKIIEKGLFAGNTAIKTMLAPDALPENISIGDALYVLNILESLNPSEGFYHFVAIIKMLYSIRMTRATYLHWMSQEATDRTKMEDAYKPLRVLLNGIVYNPRLRLTYDLYERTYNVPIDCMKIQRDIEAKNTDARKKAAIWRLLFFVGTGRISGGDLHTIQYTHTMIRQPMQYSMTRLRQPGLELDNKGEKREKVLVQLAHFNFMAVINNMLYTIDEFAKRVRYVFPDKGADAKTKEVKNCLEVDSQQRSDWWNPEKMFDLLSLSCIDVLDALILHMNKYADLREAADDETTHESRVRHFNTALKEALDKIYASRTYVKRDSSMLDTWVFNNLGFEAEDRVAVWGK